MKIGIFGGSFNPPHMGHLNSLQTVLKKSGLDEIRVIPAAQNPLKLQVEGPTPQQRLAMTKLAIEPWGKQYSVDDQEILRGGKSYTIDTVLNLRKKIEADQLYLIIGMDQFDELQDWKDISDLLKEANLIVTSRPGYEFPQSQEELPSFLKKLVEEFDFNFIELKTGRNIQFIHLQDLEVSSTELRKHLRAGKNVQKHIPLSVENYIQENKLYKNLGDRIGDVEKFTRFCAEQLFSKKGIQVRGFDLRQISAPSEFSIVSSGSSTKHSVSLAENLVRAVKEEYGVWPQSTEGQEEGRWVVVDYGSLIVHVFYDYVRQEYNLEKLWRDGIDMLLKDGSLDIKA